MHTTYSLLFKQEVWSPGSADTVCPHRPLTTLVQLYSIAPRRLRLITWPCDLDLWPSSSSRLWLMRVVVLYPYTKFEVRRPCCSKDMAYDVCRHEWAWSPWPFDLQTGMRVASKLGNFHYRFNLCTLGLRVLQLFAMYATDGQKQRLMPPSLWSGAMT